VLKNINLDIKRGEIFGIIGPTGAGKSTLLLHLNGILKGEGEIIVDNIPVTGKTEKEVREKVGIVFQNPDNQFFAEHIQCWPHKFIPVVKYRNHAKQVAKS